MEGGDWNARKEGRTGTSVIPVHGSAHRTSKKGGKRVRKQAEFQGFNLVYVSNYLPKIAVDNDSNKKI